MIMICLLLAAFMTLQAQEVTLQGASVEGKPVDANAQRCLRLNWRKNGSRKSYRADESRPDIC